MAISLSSLTPLTTAATALSNLVLVTPSSVNGYQPQQAPILNGQSPTQTAPSLMFHFEGENAVQLNSDITDHFVEDNYVINDQIALRPEEITVRGFIGELNDVPPAPLLLLEQSAEKLTTIAGYAPGLSATALLSYNEAFQLYQIGLSAVNSAVSAWSTINGGSNQTVITGNFDEPTIAGNNQNKQQLMFQQLYGYWVNRILFTVQTPWAVFQNMAIKSLRAIQNEETNVISDFEITFKIIRFASTQVSNSYLATIALGRLGLQSASQTNLGNVYPLPSISLGSAISNNYGIT